MIERPDMLCIQETICMHCKICCMHICAMASMHTYTLVLAASTSKHHTHTADLLHTDLHNILPTPICRHIQICMPFWMCTNTCVDTSPSSQNKHGKCPNFYAMNISFFVHMLDMSFMQPAIGIGIASRLTSATTCEILHIPISEITHPHPHIHIQVHVPHTHR